MTLLAHVSNRLTASSWPNSTLRIFILFILFSFPFSAPCLHSQTAYESPSALSGFLFPHRTGQRQRKLKKISTPCSHQELHIICLPNLLSPCDVEESLLACSEKRGKGECLDLQGCSQQSCQLIIPVPLVIISCQHC